ncbi:MAG TPA: hypothetical protein VLA05_00855 [Coriobacteriia bacterium]|nr:hypothetical protein [Coriobacteriia bacterium]
MEARTYILAALLLSVIIVMLLLALRLLRLQRKADEESVMLDQRLGDVVPAADTADAAVDPPAPLRTTLPSGSDTPPVPPVLEIEFPQLAEHIDSAREVPLLPAPTEDSGCERREYAMHTPVEIWFGDARVGVRDGTQTSRHFRKYADRLLADLKAAQEATR